MLCTKSAHCVDCVRQILADLWRRFAEINVQIFFVIFMRPFNLGDFTVLCSVISPSGERWLGGDFLANDRVIVWSDEGRGYLYRLPAKWVESFNMIAYFFPLTIYRFTPIRVTANTQLKHLFLLILMVMAFYFFFHMPSLFYSNHIGLGILFKIHIVF